MLLALLLASAIAVAPSAWAGPSSVQAYVLRLNPGDDLKLRLLAFARAHDLRAAYVATAVGSLKVLRLRLADRPDETSRTGKFEIVSLVGTLSRDAAHLHLAVSGSDGQTLGGHLVDGCMVYTTAEIVVGELAQVEFTRPIDPNTKYHELLPQAR